MGDINTRRYEREEQLCWHPRASKSKNTIRKTKLDDDYIRTEFQRDIHRIIYSQPFRRLKHKTQVFYYPSNDHICTRLEHVIQVASAARTIARALGLNEDLAEAIGLAHDLGHSAFGHHGEEALSKISKTHGISEVFHHEVHGLRVVDCLAQMDREPKIGLNLTMEVRDGIISHCGEDFESNECHPFMGNKELSLIDNRKKAGNPITLEGCIVRMVDKIAYLGRDLEDGLHSGIINQNDIPVNIVQNLGNNNGDITGKLVTDMINQTKTKEDCIAMSQKIFSLVKQFKTFNYDYIYLNEKVQQYKERVSLAFHTLFYHFVEVLNLTDRFSDSDLIKRYEDKEILEVLRCFVHDINYDPIITNERIALDFLAGFTDNFVFKALKSIDRLLLPELIV